MATAEDAIEFESMKIRQIVSLTVGIAFVALSPITWAAGHGGGGHFGGSGFHGGGLPAADASRSELAIAEAASALAE